MLGPTKTKVPRGAGDSAGDGGRPPNRVPAPFPKRGRPWLTTSLCLGLSAAILAFDLVLPRGVAVGTLYCVVVFATLWARDVRITLAFAVLTSFLVAAGWIESAVGGVAWMVLTNRLVSLGLVWLCAAMVVSRLMASARFHLAVEASPAGMMVLNGRGRIVLANAEAGRVFGCPASALYGLGAERLLPPAALRSAEAVIGAERLREVEAKRLGGERFPAEAKLRPIRTEVGRLTLVTVRDLSEVRRQQAVNERLAAIVRSSPDAILAKDMAGLITDWNPGAERIYGYTAKEVLGRHVSLLTPPGQEDEIAEILAAVRRGEDVARQCKRRTKDGRIIDVDLVVSPIRNRAGRVVAASASARDRTRETEAQRLLVEVHTALGHALPGKAQVDADGCIEEANTAVAELAGLAPEGAPEEAQEGAAGRPWLDLVGPEDRDAAEGAFESMLREGSAACTVHPAHAPDRALDLYLVRRQDPDGRFEGFHLFLRDVSPRVRAEERSHALAAKLAEANRRLDRQANVDPLTGILNRRGLERRIRRLRGGGMSGQKRSAVLLVDVDDFKAINEEHGHAVGDRLLVAVAERLEDGARLSDPVARIGGDEFLVLLPDTSPLEAVRVAERMRSEVARPVPVPGGDVAITCSIGVASVRAGGLTVEGAIESARNELSSSKGGGKNRVSRSEGTQAEESLAASALRGEGLHALHQPVYDLIGDSIAGYELFVRGPGGTCERPEQLFALAGRGPQRTELDLTCLRTCLAAARDLPADDACLHLNLLPSTLLEVGAEGVLRELQGLERPVCVELAQRELRTLPEGLPAQVRALRTAGVQVAIDDVGSGETALESLVVLEPDVIKLDPAWVGAAERQGNLEGLLGVAGTLRARVIAEGIEDDAALDRLVALRVRYGQGYLWGRPAAAPAERDVVLWPRPRQPRAAQEVREDPA